MAKFRMVYTEFWNDPRVVEEMTPEDKYFFLYLLTNSNATQIGIYQITKKQMAFDTGYSMESINSLLDRFIKHHKIVVYNPGTREIAIRNWGKYNLNRGGKPMIDCVLSELKEVKDEDLISYVGEQVEHSGIKELYDTFTIRGQEEDKEEDKEEEEEKDKEEREVIPYVEIINYLNDVASTKYRSSTRKTKDLIKARWNEGFELHDFKSVIDTKTAEWIKDEKMNKFLRPETLFGTKFESYLNQKGGSISGKNNDAAKLAKENGIPF
ncbi:conserved phage C-terminal domain-containing protein [Bacillus sp. FSL K6-3431]|uniref:conserved phage C-terminal domain-containing protein n=1 Tax=Bacillus sp. FSL K6-3431 TaxID=2921500 RepID=UPI0030FB215C